MDNSRERLISAALQIFSEKGFAVASTRDICDSAGVNLSAIRYYFGDKAGLYRAVYAEPLSDLTSFPSSSRLSAMALEQALDAVYQYLLAPLRHGDRCAQVMRLQFREMLDPTGALEVSIEAQIRPQHQALVGLLVHHLNLRRADADVHRLAFGLFGLVAFFYVGQGVVASVQPSMLSGQKAVDSLRVRLVEYGVAMVRSEQQRRQTPC